MSSEIHSAIYDNFILNLGIVSGGIMLPQNYNRLVDSLKKGTLNAGYISALRDRLTIVLEASEVNP